MTQTKEHRAIEWLLGDYTGISSEAIIAYMLLDIKPVRTSPPSDADDRGRCIRLLNKFPEWWERLDEIYDNYTARVIAGIAELHSKSSKSPEVKKFDIELKEWFKHSINQLIAEELLHELKNIFDDPDMTTDSFTRNDRRSWRLNDRIVELEEELK